MKVTFKRRNLFMTCNCKLMSKSENSILTSMTVRTEDMHLTELYKEEIEEADRVLIYDENDGVEFKVLTVAVINYEGYSIIRINCN